MIGPRHRLPLLLAAVLGTLPLSLPPKAAEITQVFDLRVEDATAKVGERGALMARLRVQPGYRLLEAYDNRLTRLSTEDESVNFDPGVLHPFFSDGDLVFTINVVPTKPGRHPINGVFRVGYIEDDIMRMVSVPLMASVTGLE